MASDRPNEITPAAGTTGAFALTDGPGMTPDGRTGGSVVEVCRCRQGSWRRGMPGPICAVFSPYDVRGDSICAAALRSICSHCEHDIECHEDLRADNAPHKYEEEP